MIASGFASFKDKDASIFTARKTLNWYCEDVLIYLINTGLAATVASSSLQITWAPAAAWKMVI